MKTFRDLYIELNGTDIEKLAQDLTIQCQFPWKRRKDKEDDLGLTAVKPLCFESQKGGANSPAALFLFPKDGENKWYVSNIVPPKNKELNYDQYNAILEHFVEYVVKPVVDGTLVEVEITSNKISIGSIVGSEVEGAFERFSHLANKSTGSAHPNDRERWYNFLMLANKADVKLDTYLVIRSLIELGWSEERADELGIEFEFAEGLLSYVQEL